MPDRDGCRKRFFVSLLVLLSVLPASASDDQEVVAYRLNMSRIEAYVAASRALHELAAANPALKHRVDADSESKNRTLDDMVRTVERDTPEASAAIKAAGLGTREFLVIGLSLLTNSMTVALKREGTIKAYPASISAENAAFLEKNWDRVQALLAQVPQEGNEDDGGESDERSGGDDGAASEARD